MPRKTMLSAAFAGLGLVMIVAAIFAGTASSASKPAAKPASKHALKGGTLRVNASNNDFEFSDPGLAYDTLSWSMLYTTQMLLVNFPEKSGQAGSVLYPEAATSFPTVSKDGKTYTFHIRPGLKFSDGSPVTAAAYQRAWERNLSPKMGSPVGVNDQFQSVIVGGQAFLSGKAQSISRHHRQGPDADVPSDEAEPDVHVVSRHAVVRRGQARHAVHDLGRHWLVPVRGAVLHPVARSRPVPGRGAEPVLQGLQARPTRTRSPGR